MKGVLQYATADKRFYKTAYSIAQTSLTSARGNSGTIFAQFFTEFIPNLDKNDMTSRELADQIDKVANTAQEAVMNPVRSIILTAMEDWGAIHVFHQNFQ